MPTFFFWLQIIPNLLTPIDKLGILPVFLQFTTRNYFDLLHCSFCPLGELQWISVTPPYTQPGATLEALLILICPSCPWKVLMRTERVGTVWEWDPPRCCAVEISVMPALGDLCTFQLVLLTLSSRWLTLRPVSVRNRSGSADLLATQQPILTELVLFFILMDLFVSVLLSLRN